MAIAIAIPKETMPLASWESFLLVIERKRFLFKKKIIREIENCLKVSTKKLKNHFFFRKFIRRYLHNIILKL